jgi:WD40 repeat protein
MWPCGTRRFVDKYYVNVEEADVFSNATIQDSRDNGVHATLPGHEGTVTSVRFVNDTLLVSADDRGFMKLWRNETGKVDSFLTALFLVLTFARVVGGGFQHRRSLKIHICASDIW